MLLLAFSCPSNLKEKGREIPDMGHKKPDVARRRGFKCGNIALHNMKCFELLLSVSRRLMALSWTGAVSCVLSALEMTTEKGRL